MEIQIGIVSHYDLVRGEGVIVSEDGFRHRFVHQPGSANSLALGTKETDMVPGTLVEFQVRGGRKSPVIQAISIYSHRCERCDEGGPASLAQVVEPGDPGSEVYLMICERCRAELAVLQYFREPELNPER